MAADAAEPRKKRYEVKDWTRYNEALVNRGDFTFYSEEVVDAWEHENRANEEGAKKNGRPFTYSDVAIETLLTIRELFRLPYRQTEGFGRALAKLPDRRPGLREHPRSRLQHPVDPGEQASLNPQGSARHEAGVLLLRLDHGGSAAPLSAAALRSALQASL